MNRQRNNQSFPQILTERIEDVKKLRDLMKELMPNYKFPISDKNPMTSAIHIVKYSHKNELYNLYMFLADFNKKANLVDFHEPNFKCEFYDLFELLLREKELLNDSEDVKSSYSNIRKFKIKRVERLILS